MNNFMVLSTNDDRFFLHSALPLTSATAFRTDSRGDLLCPPPHRVGVLSDDARLTTSDVCLSVAYIGPKSRTERPRKTKIDKVAHVTLTRSPLSRLKGQRSTCRGGAYCGGLPHSLF